MVADKPKLPSGGRVESLGNRWLRRAFMVFGLASAGMTTIVVVSLTEPVDSVNDTQVSGSITCGVTDASCEKLTSDIAKRRPLTQQDIDRAYNEISRIMEVSSAARAEPQPCDSTHANCPANLSGSQVNHLRVALTGAGYANPVIRVAGDNDIGPAGSIIVAVPVGHACVLSIESALTQSSFVAGQRENGTCLAA